MRKLKVHTNHRTQQEINAKIMELEGVAEANVGSYIYVTKVQIKLLQGKASFYQFEDDPDSWLSNGCDAVINWLDGINWEE